MKSPVAVGALVASVSVGALVAAVSVAAVSAASISQSGGSVGHYVQFFKHHKPASKWVWENIQ
jgi:hypothetical protein